MRKAIGVESSRIPTRTVGTTSQGRLSKIRYRSIPATRFKLSLIWNSWPLTLEDYNLYLVKCVGRDRRFRSNRSGPRGTARDYWLHGRDWRSYYIKIRKAAALAPRSSTCIAL